MLQLESEGSQFKPQQAQTDLGTQPHYKAPRDAWVEIVEMQ